MATDERNKGTTDSATIEPPAIDASAAADAGKITPSD
jgi:hypothetical protein